MGGQPAVVWDHGDGATISDAYGNTWIDFSAGVLVTSSGHGRKEIVDAIKSMADHGLYPAYCFSTEVRLKLVQELSSWLPAPLKRVFLLDHQQRSDRCCIKLPGTHGGVFRPTRTSSLPSKTASMAARSAPNSPGEARG